MNINVVFCFDEAYQQHFGVALTSLLINNINDHVTAYLLTKNADAVLMHKLDELKDEYDFSFSLLEVNETEIASFPTSKHISIAAYYRLLIPHVLPKTLDRVLYLDSDVVVNSSVKDLYTLPLKNQALAAVGGRVVTTKKRLNLQGDFYFNSGVMVIDLKYWKHQNISERCFEFLTDYREMAKYHDQDALNKVIDGNFLNLEKKWNTLTDLYNNYDVPDDSAIIHYVGSLKPWKIWCLRENKNYYWKFLKNSPWKDASPQFPANKKEWFSAFAALKKQLL